jgi:copper chaperone CopZ
MERHMKNLITVIIIALALTASMLSQDSTPQEKPKTETVKILTSAVCEMCKDRLEEAMSEIKGVTSSNLDVESKILTVSYEPELVTPDDIRKVVTKTGYDADDMPASKKAYKKLPKCCQKGGHSN